MFVSDGLPICGLTTAFSLGSKQAVGPRRMNSLRVLLLRFVRHNRMSPRSLQNGAARSGNLSKRPTYPRRRLEIGSAPSTLGARSRLLNSGLIFDERRR